MRKIGSLLFICCTLLSFNLFANTGVAFVHGTGSNSNALKNYWTSEFVNSVRKGLANQNNYLVVNCDFEQFMWTDAAAGCLADQLHSFISNKNIDDLVVITHSQGGNVMRWILSNPTWDGRYPDIIDAVRWVNAIAPSSLGTPLADAVINGNSFEQILGFILGYESDAVRQQQVSWMTYYNQDWLLGTAGRPATPVGFWSIVGSDVESSPFDSDSYCGEIQYQIALEVTQAWLNNCSDGFINCSSQTGAGRQWFKDKDRTSGGEPLSHHQSRRKCFNLDVILRDDL